jgi:hypothetical protein
MNINNSSRAFIEHNPVIGYLYIPNLYVRIMHENGGYFIKSNNIGFRSDCDFSIEKKEGIKRILVFGDSFTAGDGVKNFDRYTDILGRVLDNVEIFNFGLTSSGTDQQYLIYKEFASKMNADLVIIAPMVENIRRNLVNEMPAITHDGILFSRPKPFFKIVGSNLILQNNPVPKVAVIDQYQEKHNLIHNSIYIDLLRNIIKKYQIKNKINTMLGLKKDLYKEYKSSKTSAWRLMSRIILQWITELKVPVILVPIPWHLHYEENSIYTAENYLKRFKELEINNMVRVCDPLPVFNKFSYDEKKEFTFFHDKHFTQKGHCVLAESIMPVLTEVLKELKK